MEYVGPNLQEFFATDEFVTMNRDEPVELWRCIADAVAVAFGVGVLHNDLKPSNVLIRKLEPSVREAPVSERFAMVLIDFGESALLAPDNSGDDDPQLFSAPVCCAAVCGPRAVT